MKRFARAAVSVAGSYYYRTRALPWIWTNILNRSACRCFDEHPAVLSPKAESVLAALRQTGIASAHISDFFPPGVYEELSGFVRERWADPEVQASARAHTEQLRSEAARAGGPKKVFLVNLWAGEPVLDLGHPFIRFSLGDPILAIVNSYLGMCSKFRAWRLETTIPTPAGVRARSSQRWHRDEEDRKLVKVFLYLNDVDERGGPFTYLQHAHEGGRWRNLFPLAPPRGTVAMPGDEDEKIPTGDVRVMTGRTGTMIFCDTSGLHRGGLASDKIRFMYTSVYTSGASPWPIRYRYPQGFSADGLSPQARFAVTNDPSQREPRYYR